MLITQSPPPNSNWQLQFAHAQPPLQQHWLLRPGALTAGLRTLGTVELTVLREYPDTINSSEAWMLNGSEHDQIWIREIIMAINGTNCVVARSFTNMEAASGIWAGIRSLHTRPLADMLYNDPSISRSAFYGCQLQSQQPLYETVKYALGNDYPQSGDLVARCSVFSQQQTPLLVAECFLPEFWRIASKV